MEKKRYSQQTEEKEVTPRVNSKDGKTFLQGD